MVVTCEERIFVVKHYFHSESYALCQEAFTNCVVLKFEQTGCVWNMTLKTHDDVRDTVLVWDIAWAGIDSHKKRNSFSIRSQYLYLFFLSL
jgi:hypothetical protein